MIHFVVNFATPLHPRATFWSKISQFSKNLFVADTSLHVPMMSAIGSFHCSHSRIWKFFIQNRILKNFSLGCQLIKIIIVSKIEKVLTIWKPLNGRKNLYLRFSILNSTFSSHNDCFTFSDSAISIKSAHLQSLQKNPDFSENPLSSFTSTKFIGQVQKQHTGAYCGGLLGGDNPPFCLVVPF